VSGLWLPPSCRPTPVHLLRNWGDPFVRNIPASHGNSDKPPNGGGGGGGQGGAALGAPTNLVATANGSTQIDLTWTDNASAEGGYKIERASASTGPWTQIGTAAANSTSASATGLTATTQYWFRVRAYNGSRNGAYSSVANATTASAGPGSLATNLIGFWELEEASGTRFDSTANDLDLTDNNTVTQAAGVVGNAALFTRANSESLTRASSALLQTGDIDFTWAGWAYRASTMDAGAFPGLISKDASGASLEYAILLSVSANRLEFALQGYAIELQANNFGNVPLNTWFFVVAWHDAINNVVGIQINNGTANTASYSGGVTAQVYGFNIGTSGGSGARNWDGRLDQWGFWKRTLTVAEKTYLWNSGAGRSYADVFGASP
jgi:hypothetical protein